MPVQLRRYAHNPSPSSLPLSLLFSPFPFPSLPSPSSVSFALEAADYSTVNVHLSKVVSFHEFFRPSGSMQVDRLLPREAL